MAHWTPPYRSNFSPHPDSATALLPDPPTAKSCADIACPDPTSVHTLETSAHVPIPSYRDWLVSRAPEAVRSTMAAYRQFDATHPGHRFARLCECRTHAKFAVHDETGIVRVLSSSCRLRWCPLCAKAKRYFLSKEIAQWMKLQPSLRFMTLTIRHTCLPLREQLDTLYYHFRLLRQSPVFKQYVTGGIWFLQTHLSKSDGLWHNHLHCIITGHYFPQTILRDLWLSRTATSHIVDIRQIADIQESADYAARYAASPSNPAKLAPPSLLELMQACHGRRIVGKWGSASAVRLAPTMPDDFAHYKSIGSFTDILRMAEVDPTAKAVVTAFRNGTPVSARVRFQLTYTATRTFLPRKRPCLDPTFTFL